MRVDALQVADQVEVQRAGLDALRGVVAAGARCGWRRTRARGRESAPSPRAAACASRTWPSRNTLIARRRLASSRSCRWHDLGHAGLGEAARFLRIFLSSMSCSTRSMMSPICSMLIVNETMSVQRRLSSLRQRLARDLRQVELDRRVELVDRVVELAQLLGEHAGRCCAAPAGCRAASSRRRRPGAAPRAPRS